MGQCVGRQQAQRNQHGAGAEPGPKPGPSPEPGTKPGPKPQSRPGPESEPGPKQRPRCEPGPGPKPQPRPEPGPKLRPRPGLEPGHRPGPEPKRGLGPKPEPGPEHEPKYEPENGAGPGPRPSCVSLSAAERDVSLKRAQSMDPTIFFHRGPGAAAAERDVSLKRAQSMDPTIFFHRGPGAVAAERVEPAGVRWLRPGLRKYSCQLTIDTNTVNTNLKLSHNNRKVTNVGKVQSYPDHPDRFDVRPQLLCSNGLTGRCYWEVKWRGRVCVSVSYRRIRRKGGSDDCGFGWNDQSWSLICSEDGPQSVWHNNRLTFISSSSSSSSVSNRAAVYVDCPAGTLSFYRVSSDTLIHLHTFNTTFTQTLYPGFIVYQGSSVSLC